MIKRFRLFLGTTRLWILFFLLAFTGLANLLLNVVRDESPWAADAQTFLVIIWVLGSLGVVVSALSPEERGRWIGVIAPAAGVVILAVLFAPNLVGLASGGAIGWVIAGLLVFRPRGPQEYREAIRLFRRNQYAAAIEKMDELIKQQPQDINAYYLRAQIFRVWGKLDRARRDYQKMTTLYAEDAPDRWVAYNGLAEVELQRDHLEAARQAALKAYEIAPKQWVTTYSLGMIEDRARNSEQAIRYFNESLAAKVPEAQYRFLIYFYLARAYARQAQWDAAKQAAGQMRKHAGGLNQWQIILQSDQAQTLREVMEDDIKTAEQLYNQEITVENLA
ncbi:MAG: hypothetical protein Kow00117_23630 [Phototrophicales bacterium]